MNDVGLTFKAGLFDLSNPPVLADAHIGDDPPWDYEALGFTKESYEEVIKNAYYPLSDTTLRRICFLTVIQTHLFENGITEGLEEGYERPNMPAGYRLSTKSISDRFLVWNAQSTYQARTYCIFFHEKWADLRIWNFEEIVNLVLNTKLKTLRNLWATHAQGMQHDANLLESLFYVLKHYNDGVQRVMRQGSGVDLLNDLTLLSAGPGKSLGPRHQANWFFVGRLLGPRTRVPRNTLWPIEQDEIRVHEIIKQMGSHP